MTCWWRHTQTNVQLCSWKETIKSQHQWIKETLTNLPGKHFRRVFLLVSWDCSLYGKGPQNNQHQAQTQLRIHSFLYCNRKTNGEHSVDLILTDLTQRTFANLISAHNVKYRNTVWRDQSHLSLEHGNCYDRDWGNLRLFIPHSSSPRVSYSFLPSKQVYIKKGSIISRSIHIESASQSVGQSVTQSLCHSVTQPLSHSVTQSLSHSVTQLLSHSVTQSLSHSVTQSRSHAVTQSLSHSVTQSLSHSVTQSVNWSESQQVSYDQPDSRQGGKETHWEAGGQTGRGAEKHVDRQGPDWVTDWQTTQKTLDQLTDWRTTVSLSVSPPASQPLSVSHCQSVSQSVSQLNSVINQRKADNCTISSL